MTTKDIGPKGPIGTAAEGVVDYVEDRAGAKTGLSWFLFRNIPKETSWFQTLGFAAMAVFGLQAITGIVLAMYYKPSTETAYASIQHITHEVTFGWLVRGMHKWGATAMIVLVFLHMARVFLFGSYKYPRELTWVTGSILLIMSMFMGLTGYLLVWDEKAYWATVVAMNITASAPILGPYVADVMRAGSDMNPDTLSRFYSIHMLVIPGGIATFMGLHLFLVAKLGISEPPWAKRSYKARYAAEAEQRAAARARLPQGRHEVTSDPAPQTVNAGGDK